jgi:class 3 adenylate cyclase
LGRVVTFAFTDIEGSTTRWERDRVAMQEAVRRHDAIQRAAIAKHDGHVFKTIGDAFCTTFTRPEDAVSAMVAVQQALMAEDFSAVDGLRVRAAIHSGTADEREADYFGPALNKVARLLAIGHGGQVLLTSETASMVERALPVDVSLRDLGAYHLKDITEPERVWQLLAPGLPSDFPPLRSLGTLPSDISILDTVQFHPVPSFSGRDEELAAVHAALQHNGAIAVVHGLGGVGKSSIAREYGWRNRDVYSVAWWLNAQTEDGIVDGLLRLGAMFVQGLDQLADRRAAAQRVINSVLGGFDKPILLVFDNLEDETLMRTWLPRTVRALATHAMGPGVPMSTPSRCRPGPSPRQSNISGAQASVTISAKPTRTPLPNPLVRFHWRWRMPLPRCAACGWSARKGIWSTSPRISRTLPTGRTIRVRYSRRSIPRSRKPSSKPPVRLQCFVTLPPSRPTPSQTSSFVSRFACVPKGYGRLFLETARSICALPLPTICASTKR